MIHPTAIVDPGAELGEGVEIGPYCMVGPHVRLGARRARRFPRGDRGPCRDRRETASIHPFANLGGPPQHAGHKGEPTRLVIGARNIIREHVTMHCGTVMGRGVTTVGSDGFFMVGVHVAHDCVVGDHVTMVEQRHPGRPRSWSRTMSSWAACRPPTSTAASAATPSSAAWPA